MLLVDNDWFSASLMQLTMLAVMTAFAVTGQTDADFAQRGIFDENSG